MKVSTDACLFGAWIAHHNVTNGKGIDIGAGTGLLSLMVSQQHAIEIKAIEIEKDCFLQLQENIAASPWSSHIDAMHLDILEFNTDTKFDVILSNPPFFEHQLQSDKQQINLARHQAGLTLEKLMHKVNELLHENGVFYILMPAYRKNETIKAAEHQGLHPFQITDVKQSYRHQPFRVMIAFKRKETNISEDLIVIKNNENAYTDTFSSLLKDYYLYL